MKETVPRSEKLLLEICELLAALLVLAQIDEGAACRALVYRLRSSVCFYYAYYGAAALCRFANHLKAADAVMVDFQWLEQTEALDDPEACILYYRNAVVYGGS